MNKPATEVYWTTFIHPTLHDRPLYIAATKQGLCRITWPHESFEALQAWAEKKIPNAQLIQDPEHEQLSEPLRQLHEYFAGTRTSFSLPLDFRGTPFQTSVWQALTAIPFGQTRSYSDIAETVGSPTAVRAVGTANGANPIPIIVPCHRVLGKNNALTGFRGGLQVKETLLQLEGFHDYANKGHARFHF